MFHPVITCIVLLRLAHLHPHIPIKEKARPDSLDSRFNDSKIVIHHPEEFKIKKPQEESKNYVGIRISCWLQRHPIRLEGGGVHRTPGPAATPPEPRRPEPTAWPNALRGDTPKRPAM